MKCRRCKAPAIIDLPRHNAAFCAGCFTHQCREQVKRAIHEHHMIEPGERVLVAVSGGKDSLALWDLLHEIAIPADGLYLGLGIGDYSDESGEYTRTFANERGLHLHEVDLRSEYGYDIPGAAAATHRAPCGACGLSKRHLFNQVALDQHYDVVATGHNLDDEAAVLFGNVLRWETGYLGRQFPILAASPGFARKVKPLVRLTEREMAAYCVIRGIDYQVEECPMAAGNKHIAFKELLNQLEQKSPGTKAAFTSGFWSRGHQAFAPEADDERATLAPCVECGSPTTTGDRCAFCSLRARASAAASAADSETRIPVEVPVTLRSEA